MKQFAVASLAAVIFVACGRPVYTIDGTWADADGQTVRLVRVSADSLVIDSAVVSDGVFHMSGPLGRIEQVTMQLGPIKEKQVMLDQVPVQISVIESEIEIFGETRTRMQVDITGSSEQSILARIDRLQGQKFFAQMGPMFMMLEANGDKEKMDSIYNIAATMKSKADSDIRAFLDSMANTHAAAYFLANDLAADYSLEDMEHYYGMMDNDIRQSHAGQVLGAKIEELRSVNIGGMAPDIALPSPDGTEIRLSSLRGKVVLIDFWASWCGPCLSEAPNLKAVYDDYHSRGFEVYGVSLDDKKEAWVGAIEKHGLDWVHVSSLKQWECPVAAAYNITAIPQTFLLDREGRIVATALRGDALRERVASLFE